MKQKFYSLDKILLLNADYNVIFGERSNGKTYSVLKYALDRYLNPNDHTQLGYVRRWDEDLKAKNVGTLFAPFVENGYIVKASKGKWNSVIFRSKMFFFANMENGDMLEQDEEPFCYTFAIGADEHYKSASYPRIETILFDEFLTRGNYLENEFVKFTSILSTIIRLRSTPKIFMCGNTVNKYNPYKLEMGLTHMNEMQKGKIDVYHYGEGENTLTVAVEYSDFPARDKKSNKYFAFDSPRLKMITEGSWEMDIYPHIPMKYDRSHIKYMYFINFNDELLQCEVIYIDGKRFTYIHRKTSEIKDNDGKYLVYQIEPDVRPNYRRKMTKVVDDLTKNILWYYVNDKVFYQDNSVGETVRNYLNWCRR